MYYYSPKCLAYYLGSTKADKSENNLLLQNNARPSILDLSTLESIFKNITLMWERIKNDIAPVDLTPNCWRNKWDSSHICNISYSKKLETQWNEWMNNVFLFLMLSLTWVWIRPVHVMSSPGRKHKIKGHELTQHHFGHFQTTFRICRHSGFDLLVCSTLCHQQH